MVEDELKYADTHLLMRTIQRLKGTLHKLDVKTKDSLELSLTGFKAKLENAPEKERLNDYELIDALRKLLEVNGLIGNERPERSELPHEFIEEDMSALRVVVPSVKQPNKRDLEPLTFWLGLGDREKGVACIMEGSGADEENPYSTNKCSNYSVLQSLVHFAREQRRAGVLDDHIDNAANKSPHATINETHPRSLIEQFHNVHEFAWDFLKSPGEFLEAWDCKTSSPRNVRALYRVREYGPDRGYDYKRSTMFGYALAIYETP